MRWLVSGLLALVLLIVVAVAIFLVPPHLQIRAVTPALPSEAELRALTRVEGGPVRIRYIQNSTQEMTGRTLGHSIIVIEWRDGRVFMIDAGMDRETASEFGELIAAMQDAGDVQFYGTADEVLGSDVGRVAGVGFTHLHLDHVQGIRAFCAARGPGARVYRTTWQAREHNLHTADNAETISSSCLEAVTLESEGILTTPHFPGLGIVGLGGHTPGSTLFVVPVGGTLWLLSGDISNAKADLLSNTGKGFVYSYLIVPEDTARTEELRVWLAALDAEADIEVVVSHDIAAAAASGMVELRPARE